MKIEVKNISVKYPLKTVLKNVSQCFCDKKIHILIGENGAGKTTLTKVLCGDLIPDSGHIYINDQEVHFKSPKDAIDKGIICVHQTPLLAEEISVKENLLLGLSQFNKKDFDLITGKWLKNIKLSTATKNLGGDERFFTALSTALLKKPSVLILDEPSALLDFSQRDFLFNNLRDFADSGMTIIIITHNMEEARKYGDTITYLHEGEVKPSDESFINRQEKFSLEQSTSKNSGTYIEFKNLTSRPIDKPAIFDINFTAYAGELTLICGTTESGRETLEDLICGMTDKTSGNNCSGTLTFHKSGQLNRMNGDSPQLMTNKHIHGDSSQFKLKKKSFSRYTLEKSGIKIGIMPSNKDYRGSNPNLTVFQILTGKINGNRKKLIDHSMRIIKNADIKIKPQDKAVCLSGGMLQRILLEREIDNNPDILILCEPLQGLDVISSEKLCKRLLKLASEESKIILILSSSEFPKEICTSVYNLNSGICTAEYSPHSIRTV